ncbi:hypothetical protein GF312_01145, partial [Candidatus Poribacteria bacterium]|nr:hypothetical protein [Candidatus Poribacteria bacterium]
FIAVLLLFSLSEVHSESTEKTKIHEIKKETKPIPEPAIKKTEDKPKPAQTEELEKTEKKDDDQPYYSIQVGAFSRQRNAEKIINRLKSKGYTVYMLEPVPGESALYKVRVGKFKSRTDMVDVVEILRDVEKLPIDVVYVK